MTIIAPKAGQVISSSRYLQPVADELNKGAGPKNRSDNPSSQSAASAAAASETSAGTQSALFVGESANTITAQLDSTLELVTVAKPPLLRGHVGTRINADGDTEEIHPAYHPAYKLLIVEVDATGIAGVTWADQNWDARRWAIEV